MIYVLYRDAAEIQNFETSVQNIIAAPQGRADLESYMAEVRPMLASFAEITTNGISGQETITATSDAMIDLLGQFEAYANRIEDPEISVVHQWTKSWLRDSASAWVLLRHQEQGMVIGNRAELSFAAAQGHLVSFVSALADLGTQRGMDLWPGLWEATANEHPHCK